MSLICYRGEAPPAQVNFKEDLSRRFFEGTSLDPAKGSQHESLGDLVRSIMKVPVPDVTLQPISKERIAGSLFMTEHGMREERMALQRSSTNKQSDTGSVHYSQTMQEPRRGLHNLDSQINPGRAQKMARFK